MSLGLYGGSDLDKNIQQLMHSKSDTVGIEHNITASDGNEFMNNIIKDLTTLVNNG